MALLKPPEITEAFTDVGAKKGGLSIAKMLGLGFMAGVFIALASTASNIASTTITNASLARFVGASVFPVGLLLVILAGGELFTGNALMTVSFLSKKLSLLNLIKNWVFVYIGNFLGSMFVAMSVIFSGQLGFLNSEVLNQTLRVANHKCSFSFSEAVFLGILCNMLVCLAVWIAAASDSASGKFAVIYLPVMLVVLCAFEHSVANMYYIPAGLFANLKYTVDLTAYPALTLKNFLVANLLPVTIGNIIGGGIMVGGIYKMIFIPKNSQK